MWERAAVIAVGDEVLTGEVVNTNGAWLASQLLRVGSRAVLQMAVGDDAVAIAGALRTARQVADLILFIGGLGPTPDDLTREAVADVLGVSLHLNQAVADRIRARHRRGPGHEASIRQQSQVLAGAEVIANDVGTAPGQLLRLGTNAVALLPGPPAECRSVADHLWPHVEAATGRRVVRHTWRCYDLPESEMAHHLGDILTGIHPRAGIYTRPGVVELRLEAPAEPGEGLPAIIARAGALARGRLPAPLYDDEALPTAPEALIAILASRRQTVAIAESLTGGLLSAQLTLIPGASEVVMEGNVVYTEAAKERLGCPAELVKMHGAVSQEVARALAEQARARAGTDWGVALTGFAGPGGGTDREPVGTYYCAVAGAGGTRVRRRSSRLGRAAVREAACETARFMLAQALMDVVGD
jgi:nicotinamide-nucleotide amidase